MSTTSRKVQGGPAVAKNANNGALQESASQERFEQLVQEVRVLEAYHQEIATRQQALSAAVLEARAALDALDTLSKEHEEKKAAELLIPIGGGTLLPVKADSVDRLVVSVGAGVAVEKDKTQAKSFLTLRMQESEKALSALEEQRKEIASRLQMQRNVLQRMAQQ